MLFRILRNELLEFLYVFFAHFSISFVVGFRFVLT